MEKIQNQNGFRFREINVYIHAQDSENPLFQCWLTFVQEEDCDYLRSVSGIFYYGYGDEYGNPSGFIHDMDSDYILGFFENILLCKLCKPGDMIQGDRNSYAAAIAEFVMGGILGNSDMIYDGDCTVMRILK